MVACLFRGFFLMLLLTGNGCLKHSASTSSPGAQPFQWQHAHPDEMGLSPEAIDSLGDNLFARDTKKLLIIINDKIIYERYAEGWHDSVKGHFTASLAKALVGGMSLSAAI